MIRVYNRQRQLRVPLAALQDIAPRALAACRTQIRPGAALAALEEIEVSLVSDRAITAVHRQFLGDATATDVITFQHGELIVSAETAAANARRFEISLFRELTLYIVHGLLHLAGYDDLTPRAARQISQLQQRLLQQILP